MSSPKNENLLNLSLEATEEEREKSPVLMTGYDEGEERWELIVKYSGDLDRIRELLPGTRVQSLLNAYSILEIAQADIPRLADIPQIQYIEMPKRLYFALARGKAISCITSVQNAPENLSGKGVLVGIVDSGERVIIMPG